MNYMESMSKRIMWPCFIISGKKQSGKDLTANIIQWIVNNVATDDDFKLPLTFNNFKNNKIFNKDLNSKYVSYGVKFTFASGLKKMLSIIFNIPLSYFESDSYKSNYYINLKTFEHIDNTKQQLVITPTNDIKSLREIMQEVGKYIEPYFGEDIWAKSIIKNVQNLINNQINTDELHVPIITDLRRKIELSTIKNNLSPKNYVILRIIRKLTPYEWLYNLNIYNEFNNIKYISLDYLFIDLNKKITIKEFIDTIINNKIIINNDHIKNVINTALHNTEIELDNYDFDYVIYNDGTPENLFNQIILFIDRIKINYYN